MSLKCQQVGIPLDDIFIISWLILTNVMSLNCYQEYILTYSIFTIENEYFCFCSWSSHGHVTNLTHILQICCMILWNIILNHMDTRPHYTTNHVHIYSGELYMFAGTMEITLKPNTLLLNYVPTKSIVKLIKYDWMIRNLTGVHTTND